MIKELSARNDNEAHFVEILTLTASAMIGSRESVLVTYGGTRHDIPLIREACIRNGVVMGRLSRLQVGIEVQTPETEPKLAHVDLEELLATSIDPRSQVPWNATDIGRFFPGTNFGLTHVLDDTFSCVSIYMLYWRWLTVTSRQTPSATRKVAIDLRESVDRLRPRRPDLSTWLTQFSNSPEHLRLVGRYLRSATTTT